MRLFEFTTSGDGRSGPYAFYLSALKFAKQYASQWASDDDDDDEGEVSNQEDARELESTANAFLKGMENGISAFESMDTFLKDELAEHWEDDGLDVRGEIYDRIDAKTPEPDKYKAVITSALKKQINVVKSWTREIQANIDSGEDDKSTMVSHLRLIQVLEMLLKDFSKSTEDGIETLKKMRKRRAEDGFNDAHDMMIKIFQDNNILHIFPKEYMY